MSKQPRWPFGVAAIIALAIAATVAHEVDNSRTVITLTGTPAADATLNLTLAEGLEPGAEVFVKWTCGATAYDLVLGTGCETKTIDGTISKTTVVHLVFDGTRYVVVNVSVAY